MTKQLPRIPRFITEKLFSERTIFFIKYSLVGAISGALLIAVALQGFTLRSNLRQADQLTQDRERIAHEVVYWKQIADTYSGYRDIYYRIATLQYKLGNKDEANTYVKKALEIDPNFQEAQVLGAKIAATAR